MFRSCKINIDSRIIYVSYIRWLWQTMKFMPHTTNNLPSIFSGIFIRPIFLCSPCFFPNSTDLPRNTSATIFYYLPQKSRVACKTNGKKKPNSRRTGGVETGVVRIREKLFHRGYDTPEESSAVSRGFAVFDMLSNRFSYSDLHNYAWPFHPRNPLGIFIQRFERCSIKSRRP